VGAGPASQGAYSVVVRNANGFVISGQAVLTVIQSLEILTQPLSQVTDIGGAVTFRVFAVGTGNINYQWRFNGADLSGATGDTLILSDLQPEDSGNYTVLVTDDNGLLESAQATLEVLSPPVITQQPQSQTVVAYTDTFLSVKAGGQGPFTYQWRLNGVNIQGATSAFLPLSTIQLYQEGIYTVVVFNPVSSTISDEAVITLLIPATILQQPASQFVDPEGSATLSVVATSSTPISYQWRFNDIDIPGATGPSLTLNNLGDLDTGNYQVLVTDGVGTIRSEIALVVVLTQPSIVIPPLA